MNHLDRLYTLLETSTGIKRNRDTRLELIAADRALEARFQVGTIGATGIQHPVNQLLARTYHLHPSNVTEVREVATWHYYGPTQVDPIQALVDFTLSTGKIGWMNSPEHEAILRNADLTTWGLGLHYEDVPDGNRRWYAIGVLTKTLRPLQARRFTVAGGDHTGYQFTAKGDVIGSKTVGIGPAGSGALYDVRVDVPNKGPHLHVVNGAWRNYWLPESAAVQAARL